MLKSENINWNVRHCGKERDGFELRRDDGLPVYTFWHFFNSVDLLTPDGIITTKPNACYVCPPLTRQHFISHGPLLHDWFHFDEVSAEKWLSFGLVPEKLYYPEPIKFVTDIIEEIETENYSERIYFEEFIELKLSELFIGIARACNPPKCRLNSETVELFHKIRIKMLNSLECDYSVEALANEAHISSSYFHSVYKELFGISPAKDLTDNRIKSAKYRLLNSSLPVGEIALLSGYKSLYHFSKQFKKYVGISPAEFRKQSR